MNNVTNFKDLAITKKFVYLSEVNVAMNASIDAAKKHLDSISKFMLTINQSHLKTNGNASSGNQ